MTKSNRSIIKANNLKVSFGDRVIWERASFEINKAEYVGILGPNGAGKTTLIKLLLGLLSPDSGNIQVFGKNPSKGNPRIGYVPQRRPIDSDMNLAAIELVKLGINGTKWGWQTSVSSRIDEQTALEALEQVSAGELADQPLGILSGGELQRIFLAQALVGKPELLLLDEPLANLDIRHEVNLVQLIDKVVREQKVSVLLIAHDLNPLLPVLDKVVYVANGRVSSGRPSEIVTSKSLSKLYGSPIEVLRDSKGRVAILGIEESAHPHA
jgi:zinc/manganese transport system ATP-binding protein